MTDSIASTAADAKDLNCDSTIFHKHTLQVFNVKIIF